MSARFARLFGAAALLIASASCGGAEPAPPRAAVAPPPLPTGGAAPSSSDPLGGPPALAQPAAYVPPVPTVLKTKSGTTVWLLERHNLPVIGMCVALPVGSANDPAGKGGLAFATAGMLDEGAGARGPLELARAIDLLGADLHTTATDDASIVVASVLKKNLTPLLGIVGDVLSKPRFEEKEWRRVHDLWLNELRQRQSDPSAVLQVVSRSVLFGADHPYAHPIDGTAETASRVSLADVKRFYAETWRPDTATIVVVGDVTKDELLPMLDTALAGWKAPATPPPTTVTPPPPSGARPRIVLVDRADAPQANIALVRTGLAASDPNAAPLSRANTALGGSFTSRLNQDLREEHGWSYGAGSRVSFSRGIGSISAGAAVFTDKTGDALAALIADTEAFAKKGLTEDEVKKTRSQARGELVEVFEHVLTAASRLGSDAALGLPADHQAKASVRRDSATKEDLDRLAARYYDPQGATLVIVGPRAQIAPQLAKLKLPEAELWTAEGRPLAPRAATTPRPSATTVSPPTAR